MHTRMMTCSPQGSEGARPHVFVCLPQVCHHPDCQDLNNKSPLQLCESCDSRCHSDETDSMHFDRHPRFDLQTQSSILARNVSTRSCPTRTSPPSDLDEEEEGSTEKGERKVGPMKIRKKPRRRYTEDPTKECFTLKFDLSVDVDTEIVPALKKKTLREVLGPVFERKGIELSRVDLFLDQSNTPLSLSFEAYPFGGHYIKVKARPGDELKVEKEVKESLTMPNMNISAGGSPYILNPSHDKTEHGSLTPQDSVDILGQSQARRRKNMTEFLGDANIPSPDSLVQLGGSLPTMASAGYDKHKNRSASRFSGFFFPSFKEVDRMERLNNRLQMYTCHGMPKVHPHLSFHHDSWEEEEEEPDLTLEDSWQQLLENPETLSRRQFHQQEAIWELFHTEATYIKKLKVITDLFLCGLLDLQDTGLLNEVEPAKLFNNIQDLVRVHTALWSQVMLPALRKARQDRSVLDPTDLFEGFQTFASRFQPYLHYCMEEESGLEYMRTQLRDNELFRIYITWAEGNKQCNRLKLADMLAKPHQRLTKYPLLLKTILKKTDEPAAKDSLLSMVASVEHFINSVDSQMLRRQEQQKLTAISARVESYEAVEGGSEEVERILKAFNRIDLTAPMMDVSSEETRQLHLEGALRMKEGKDSRMEVYCILFTDLLLITKPVKRLEKVKVIRQPLLLHNVVCKELKDPGSFVLIYLNEFKSAVAAYSFQANSASQGRSWIDTISTVKTQLQRLRVEEARRHQAGEKTSLVKEEDEDGGEQSSNSTSSSPRLGNKGQLNTGDSDGSTETLSVMETEDSGACSDLQTDSDTVPSSLPSSAEPQPSQHALEGPVLDPEYRSLSMDSAYGTLSPELLLDLQTRTSTSEQESTEEEAEGDGAEVAAEEVAEAVVVEVTAEVAAEDEEKAGEEEEESDDKSSPGSRISVASHLKPRRRPPVQSRTHCLQKTVNKCHSEDNLLQRVNGEDTQGAAEDVAQGSNAPYQLGLEWADGLAHSKSLTELNLADTEISQQRETERTQSERLAHSLPSYVFRNTLRRRNYRRDKKKGKMDHSGSDGEIAPPGSQEGHCGASEDETGSGKISQQHKKLTLSQLYKIRTTLVLNSTLTASEV
ncbi:pleckstrin homology domain-containing family G member 5 isoform X3 [Ictalurus punctatus]|uniref:Pleckstrin homology domain-containing family G member 5 isoform X3 n=1 Tax=Ictalurus punctatus TaxID=7998 RepID=A0A9F7TNR0_ICTPU|nr:pleckstrin homology domain-containing family G member 5 isoform X3 [Ictalurus punctatus]